MLLNKNFQNSYEAVKTRLGSDVDSDHVALVDTVKAKFIRMTRTINKNRKIEAD